MKRMVLALVTFGLTLCWVALAGAHTGFESSTPADGDVVDQPISEISITFTGPAEPAGEGFAVLDTNGVIREPDEISSADQLTWVLRFDEPLTGGTIGVRWMVAAPDTHPIDGSFTFEVAAEPPTPDPTDGEPAQPDEGRAATTIDEPRNVTTSPPEAAPAADSTTLEEFLTTDDSGSGIASALGAVGRLLTLPGAVLIIGGAAFSVFVAGTSTAARDAAVHWTRRGGLLGLVGAITEAAALFVLDGSSWITASVGVAIALRLIGSALAATRTPDHRSTAVIGFALLVATSFAFDGHTVSEGPRWLHAASNAIHVIAAGTWAGGIIVLATVLWRSRRRAPVDVWQLAARFSSIASVAVVAAGIAGVALTTLVIDAPSDLWSTSWGRLLLLKSAVVGAAAATGAYNHFVMVPALENTSTAPAVIGRFRSVLLMEGGLVATAAVVTAFLVAASTTA